MRLADQAGRAVLVVGDEVVDVAEASGGALGPGTSSCYEGWDDLVDLAASGPTATGPLVEGDLRCPVSAPRQVFAIGLNYRSHAEESGMPVPSVPATFTKFPTSLTGPFDEIPLAGDAVDWEVELVVVVGRRVHQVREEDAWAHVAGLCVGQDVSDRTLQFAAGGQFSLGKSRPGYGPMGPCVVSVDELADPDDLALGCAVDGEVVQDARTSDMILSVPRLVAELSAILPLLPGDVIFTGTPAGVGFARRPSRSLRPGQVLTSWVEGVGTIRNTCR